MHPNTPPYDLSNNINNILSNINFINVVSIAELLYLIELDYSSVTNEEVNECMLYYIVIHHQLHLHYSVV